jgi:hypothetical protein
MAAHAATTWRHTAPRHGGTRRHDMAAHCATTWRHTPPRHGGTRRHDMAACPLGSGGAAAGSLHEGVRRMEMRHGGGYTAPRGACAKGPGGAPARIASARGQTVSGASPHLPSGAHGASRPAREDMERNGPGAGNERRRRGRPGPGRGLGRARRRGGAGRRGAWPRAPPTPPAAAPPPPAAAGPRARAAARCSAGCGPLLSRLRPTALAARGRCAARRRARDGGRGCGCRLAAVGGSVARVPAAERWRSVGEHWLL